MGPEGQYQELEVLWFGYGLLRIRIFPQTLSDDSIPYFSIPRQQLNLPIIVEAYNTNYGRLFTKRQGTTCIWPVIT